MYVPLESVSPFWSGVIETLSPVVRARDFLSGVLQLSHLVYFISAICISLLLAMRVVASPRFRLGAE